MHEEPQKARTKLEFRDLFKAYMRAISKSHLSTSELARLLDMKPCKLMNQMNPGEYEQAPSLLTYMRVLDLLRSRDMADSIASLANCCTIPTRAHLKPMPAAPSTIDELASAATAGQHALHEYINRQGVAQTVAVRDAMTNLIDIAHAIILATQTPRPRSNEPAGSRATVHPTEQSRNECEPVSGSSLALLHTGTEDRDINLGYR